MKSLLIPFAFLSLVSLVVGQGCNNTEPGKLSGVICVSKTQYVFPWEELTPYNCTAGTVCADVPAICTNSSEPLCKNINQGSSGTCNECIDQKPNRVCISDTTYSVCNQGIVLENLVYTCPSSTPYCKATFNNETQVVKICEKYPVDLDCSGGNGTTTEPPTTPPGTTNCTKEGFFADPSSTDCTRYFKCQSNTKGGYDQLTFTCSIAGQKFNPSTVKCESSYTCP